MASTTIHGHKIDKKTYLATYLENLETFSPSIFQLQNYKCCDSIQCNPIQLITFSNMNITKQYSISQTCNELILIYPFKMQM